MTQYEIIERVPSGLKVKVFYKGQEVWFGNVPAQHAQTRAMLESFLRIKAADKLKEFAIPQDVLDLTGRRPL